MKEPALGLDLISRLFNSGLRYVPFAASLMDVLLMEDEGGLRIRRISAADED